LICIKVRGGALGSHATGLSGLASQGIAFLSGMDDPKPLQGVPIMNRHDALTLGATFLILSSGAAANAQTPKMKMTTEIPKSITTPDQVETRIGTLNFFDGFPDKATVEKVYDNLDFQRGVQAYLTALPAVSIEGARRGVTGFGSVNQTVLISEHLLDSKSLFLTANTTCVYRKFDSA
jgi:hypothetical protein